MTNTPTASSEQQKPANPASNPQQTQGNPQQNQGDQKSGHEKPGQQQQK